jgi:cell division protease FtsH
MLKKNRDILDKIAAHLIEKETITGHEFMEIYCKEKGIPVPPPKDNALQFGRSAQAGVATTAPAPEVSQPVINKPEETMPEKPEEPAIPAPSEDDEESYFTKPEEETYYGISKAELEELNEIVDEEIKKEEDRTMESSDVPADDDDEFQDILNKRAEGKGDEVE